jgi:hypothetical protein
MEHATLSDYNHSLTKHYTALSYVWGDSTEKRHIMIDGYSFHVGPNLHSALCHIRGNADVIKIWADAICINQSDTAERNQQVQQMGSVYSIARHTITYLGHSSNEVDTLFADLSSLFTGIRTPFSVERIDSKYNDTALESLGKIIQAHIAENTWFTRVWIFQDSSCPVTPGYSAALSA